MALKSYALTTVARLQAYLEISSLNSAKQTVMESLINIITEYIENYIGYRVKSTTYTQEEYDTDGGKNIVLKNFPVDDGSAVVVQRRNSVLNEDNWETVDSQYYFVDYKAGIIEGVNGWKWARSRRGYRVTYTAGFDFDNSSTFLSDTEGGDLELAAWILGSILWNQRKGQHGVISERIGDYAVTFAKALMENEDLKSILEKYRRIEAHGVQTPYVY